MFGDLAWKPILGGEGTGGSGAPPVVPWCARMNIMRGTSRLAVLVSTSVLAASCGGAPAPAAKSVGLPTEAPQARIVSTGPCLVVGSKGPPAINGSRTPLEIGASPRSAVVIWVPGMNARPCRAELTRLGKTQSRALAIAIDAAPLFPSGVLSCPAYDGGAADVYFAYRGTPSVVNVWISLAGCRSVNVLNRWPRRVDSSITDVLRTGAPRAWRRYLGG